MLKRNIYVWHRRLSLIIALPLVLSAGSGILHPVMTNIRPAVATQGLSPVALDSSQLRLSLRTALDTNHIIAISSMRVVHIDTNWFYQVQRGHGDVPVYISTRTGKVLPKGDYLYAQYLARQFLEGQSRMAGPLPPTEDMGAGSMVRPVSMTINMDMVSSMPDCCNAATSAVLNAKGSKVSDETRLESFDEEYAEVNRLLPVYKVAFDRPDGMRIYVETVQDRFALAVDDRRAALNKVFQYIHTYQWLDFLGRGKQVVVFLLIGLAFVTTLLGMYIFFSTRSKRVPGNGYVRARRNHRYTAIVVSLFTAMFTFSGAWHALAKLKKDTRRLYFVRDRFPADNIRFDFGAIQAAVGGPVAGVSLVAMDGRSFWQVTLLPRGAGRHGDMGAKPLDERVRGKDLMRDMQVRPPEVAYVASSDYTILPDGEKKYARYLATQFSGHPESMIVGTAITTKFDGDYNFTDKRLPVWKVSYPVNHHERYYVETSTGSLSVRVDDMDLLENYSFAFFHKHEFLGAFGKPVKDTSTMFWAAAQLFAVAFGLVLFFRARKRRRADNSTTNQIRV
jgi:hypothetical protein